VFLGIGVLGWEGEGYESMGVHQPAINCKYVIL
jgi:hypothetical protein